MKEFTKSIKCVLLYQIICWGLFILCDENKLISQTLSEEIAMITGIIVLIVLLIIYFIFSNKYIKKNNLDSKKFNILLFIIWIISSISIMFVLFNLVENEYLHVCDGSGWDCFLNGIEYGIEGILMIFLAILILIIRIIIMFYKYIVKSKNN